MTTSTEVLEALVRALTKCRDELEFLSDGSIGGVPNAIAANIHECVASADEAIRQASIRGGEA